MGQHWNVCCLLIHVLKVLFKFCIMCFDHIHLLSPSSFIPHLTSFVLQLCACHGFCFVFSIKTNLCCPKYSWICSLSLEHGGYTVRENWPFLSWQLRPAGSSLAGVGFGLAWIYTFFLYAVTTTLSSYVLLLGCVTLYN